MTTTRKQHEANIPPATVVQDKATIAAIFGRATPGAPADFGRPFAELRETGLLWLLNRVVFHPRGYALALHFDDSYTAATGWSLMGDGTEPWSMGSKPPSALERAKYGAKSEDELFALVKALMP